MPYTAAETAHWMNVRAKRLNAEKCQKRQLVFKRSAAISFCILAVYIAWSPAMTAIEKMSVWVAADVSPSAASSTSFTWAFKPAAAQYNSTYTTVHDWVHNITPTNEKHAPVAKPLPQSKPAPPAPPPPPPLPLNQTNDAEDTTGYTTNQNTTGGGNTTKDGPKANTTDTDSETDSPSTVLRVLGDVAVFAGSFVGYACYFFATQG